MSNDRRTHDAKSEAEYPDGQKKADDITDIQMAKNHNVKPTTIENAGKEDAKHSDADHEDVIQTYHVPTHATGRPSNEYTVNILREDLNPYPINSAPHIAPSTVVRDLIHTGHADGVLTFQLQQADTAYYLTVNRWRIEVTRLS